MTGGTLCHTSVLYTDSDCTVFILQVARSHVVEESSNVLSAIDYFGTGVTIRSQSSPVELDKDDGGDEEEEEEEEGSESGDSGAGGKRKQRDEDLSKEKKRPKSDQVEGKGCGFFHRHLFCLFIQR